MAAPINPHVRFKTPAVSVRVKVAAAPPPQKTTLNCSIMYSTLLIMDLIIQSTKGAKYPQHEQ